MDFAACPPLRAFRRCTPSLPLLIASLLALTACAQDPLQRFPHNYKLLLDNPRVSVIRVHYGPHEFVGVHDHSDLPTLFVYLNDSGPVRFRIEDIPPATLVRPPAKLGSFSYTPGRIERHSVQNLSDTPSDFLRIELKQFPLQSGEVFRHDAPGSLDRNLNVSEFTNTQLEVDRIICRAPAPCSMPAANEPALLVALSPMHVDAAPGSSADMQTGEIRWIDPSEPASISPSTAAPAHLLRILVKSPKPPAPVS